MVETNKLPGVDEAQELEWIEAAQAEDRDAFDRLLRRYQDDVYNLCYRMMGDHEEAGDCAQETFIKVYRALRKFRRESRFSTWLYTITVNTCRTRLGSADYRRRRRMVPVDPPDNEQVRGTPIEIEDPAPSALVRLTEAERHALLQQAIDNLAEDARTVIVLRDIEGLSYEEISEITGFPLGTVKSKLARARQSLIGMLKGVL
jgi:RNA polymerase sigma-70 factor (ECF subfamily)